MNVTRDVIYDLLPGYFSGDLSPDTRALVDEFLAQGIFPLPRGPQSR
jgi:hypothetical protein